MRGIALKTTDLIDAAEITLFERPAPLFVAASYDGMTFYVLTARLNAKQPGLPLYELHTGTTVGTMQRQTATLTTYTNVQVIETSQFKIQITTGRPAESNVTLRNRDSNDIQTLELGQTADFDFQADTNRTLQISHRPFVFDQDSLYTLEDVAHNYDDYRLWGRGHISFEFGKSWLDTMSANFCGLLESAVTTDRRVQVSRHYVTTVQRLVDVYLDVLKYGNTADRIKQQDMSLIWYNADPLAKAIIRMCNHSKSLAAKD